MERLILVLVLLSGINSLPYNLNTEGFYWRDYAGSIPSDALPGGRDYNGKPIYIGKVLFEQSLIPAKIYEGDRTAYFEYAGAKTATTNIQILCTMTPHLFDWIQTKNNEVHLLTTENLIIGGHEGNENTYIGRATVEGEVSIGKIVYSPPESRGIWTVKDGKNYHFESYDILAYNNNVTKKSELSNDLV